ncbi:alpha/beta hydrolase [Sphingobacterium spiritivorum]|uniref:alpha/beta hydrolase n=1 Tax=Sphingobacterium spiritivorum TaxID=258 RepID=UPI0036965EB9
MVFKRILSLFFSYLIFVLPAFSQSKYQVIIEVKSTPATHRHSPLYITGNFNGWNPKLHMLDTLPSGTTPLHSRILLPEVKAGLLEFKFTRGDWQTLESTAIGTLTAPRNVMIQKDTVIRIDIAGWRDDFPASTASPQVHLLDSAFYIPQLAVKRAVWIYLPKDYATSDKKYPVLYMHDGQDLFDEATSQGRIGPLEWGVDEAIDRHRQSAIVVAVAHAESKEDRQNEYFVSPNSRFPNPQGAGYLKFIVHTLKPYIDSHYRTMPDKKHTAMAGSSVGGLLTLYAGLSYPDVFGSLGVFSPSIWLDEGQVQKTITRIGHNAAISDQHYYFYGGGNENRIKPDGSTVTMNTDVLQITDMLREKNHPQLEISINPEGRHGAWYWHKAFPAFYDWWQAKLN